MPKPIYIGIDPGVQTGMAVWDKKFLEITSDTITKCMTSILAYHEKFKIKVIVEDARQRKKFGDNSHMKQQGAGSIKRDCKVWEDFCNEEGIDALFIHPMKGGTKMKQEQFKKLTGWEHLTNEHGRDAGMIVFGR